MRTYNEGITACERPSRGRYVQGCRCYACRVANADYAREQSHHTGRTQYVTGQPTLIKCRRHVEKLMAAGISSREIAKVTGISRTSIQKLLNAKPKTTKLLCKSYKALMALTVENFNEWDRLPSKLVDGQKTAKAISKLVDMGLTKADIARISGVPDATIYALAARAQWLEITESPETVQVEAKTRNRLAIAMPTLVKEAQCAQQSTQTNAQAS